MVEAQLMDPLTGFARGDNAPTLNELNTSSGNWTQEQVEGGLYAIGYECNTDNAEWFVGAMKGKGKSKGKGKGNCFNCGEPGHFARGCANKTQEVALRALTGKGKGQ